MGDGINPKGWKLDGYRTNPVILFGHDASQLPVAECPFIAVQGDRLVGDAQLPLRACIPLPTPCGVWSKAGI